MNALKYNNSQLPGEIFWRDHRNELESQIREYYRNYQEWRMKTGLPMCDIDDDPAREFESFNSMINQEYDFSKDYALLEMKHAKTPDYVIENIINCFNPTKRLANKAKIPFFVVKYHPAEEYQVWQFTVYPANELAQKFLKEPRHMSERNYAIFLYGIRGIPVPKEISDKLSNQIPL